jgi:hypothetical protein
MNREVEDIIVARERYTQLLFRILRKVYIKSIRRDCHLHLEEMRNDPSYIPENITLHKMKGG